MDDINAGCNRIIEKFNRTKAISVKSKYQILFDYSFDLCILNKTSPVDFLYDSNRSVFTD